MAITMQSLLLEIPCRTVVFNMIGKFSRHRNLLSFTAVITCVIIILHTILSPDLYFLTLTYENVSCYYEPGVEMPYVNEQFNPPAKSIFFHETSYRDGLNSRQACAVEAAARKHASWHVYVLFLGSVTYKTKSLRILKQLETVKFARIKNLEDYAVRTPLQKLAKNGAFNKSKYRMIHTADVLRYLTLYKWGGIYLDLDTVVAKSLEGLEKNWSAREDDENVAAGAMAFSRDDVGRKVADAAINDLAVNFRGDDWGSNGPGVITRVLKDMCGVQNLANMSIDYCQGFAVYPPELFYPIRWQEAKVYFDPGEISDTPYLFHVWNKMTRDMKVTNSSLYAKLAEKYCPSIYESYGQDFGV